MFWVGRVGGECLLLLADKNISVLDLVMPRGDYWLAASGSGLYSLSGGWLPVLETGAKVVYIVIGAGWKQRCIWSLGLALSQHQITCLIKDQPRVCSVSAALQPGVHFCCTWESVSETKRWYGAHLHKFPPPFLRSRPWSLTWLPPALFYCSLLIKFLGLGIWLSFSQLGIEGKIAQPNKLSTCGGGYVCSHQRKQHLSVTILSNVYTCTGGQFCKKILCGSKVEV